MDIKDVIMTRKSVRTFDGRLVSDEDLKKLRAYIEDIGNPYDIPVKFVLLDAKEHGLKSPVINGEHLYIAAKVPEVPHCAEAFGYTFEKMVLYAWSLGIGTTWIAGTMKREVFEAAAETGDDELMMCVSPIGYPAPERADIDKKLRRTVKADSRNPREDLFFEGDFTTPVQTDEEIFETIRWAPSAANKQPCRIVRCGNAYHFYEKHTLENAAKGRWDVQKVDMGIALCHFMSVAGGSLTVSDPGIAACSDTDYIATVTI